MELDELYWFLEYKPRTETRENVYLITMVSRKPRQIVGHVVSRNRSARTIQRMVDKAEEAEIYCTDGYSGYLDVVFPGKHLFNIHSKKDTFTVEGVNADLRHYIPTLARKSRCFPRADVFQESWRTFRPFLLFSFMPTTGLAVTKTPIVYFIPDLLSLFLSSTSFNSSFGHSPISPAPCQNGKSVRK